MGWERLRAKTGDPVTGFRMLPQAAEQSQNAVGTLRGLRRVGPAGGEAFDRFCGGREFHFKHFRCDHEVVAFEVLGNGAAIQRFCCIGLFEPPADVARLFELALLFIKRGGFGP